MAKAASKSEVATIEENKNQLPAYLQGEKSTGMQNLDAGDFKIPRIKMLQPLSPEVKSFPGVAIPGEFWHTGTNVSLGSEFNFVVCKAQKRVILWNPRENGGGMLAFSADGVNWTQGGNKSFPVKIKGVKEPVVYETKGNVRQSGLLEFGSSNPAADDEKLPPAAMLSYEYLIYLPDHPELSPVVISLTKTAQKIGKQFNTSLLMAGGHMQSRLIKCTAKIEHSGENEWFNPMPVLNGYVDEKTYKLCKQIEENNSDYKTEYEQEEGKAPAESSDY